MTTFQIGDIVALTPEANRLKVIAEMAIDGYITLEVGSNKVCFRSEMITLISRPETPEQKLTRLEAENAIMRRGLHAFFVARTDEVARVSGSILADADAVAVKLAT
jgi:hypothetical protein